MPDLVKSIVSNIKNNQKAQIKLSTLDGEILDLDCIFIESSPPHFHLEFPTDILPDNIDVERKHPVAIFYENYPILLDTKICNKKDDAILEMIAKDTVDPSIFREYFRVDITTQIQASYKQTSRKSKNKNWALTGKTQDLSGTGVLALFSDEPKNKKDILLEIDLPGSNIVAKAAAHIVRIKKLRKLRWQVAFHFDTINDQDRDHIVQCCLREQRKLLREKVQVAL